jgi:hypothetical protein
LNVSHEQQTISGICHLNRNISLSSSSSSSFLASSVSNGMATPATMNNSEEQKAVEQKTAAKRHFVSHCAYVLQELWSVFSSSKALQVTLGSMISGIFCNKPPKFMNFSTNCMLVRMYFLC